MYFNIRKLSMEISPNWGHLISTSCIIQGYTIENSCDNSMAYLSFCAEYQYNFLLLVGLIILVIVTKHLKSHKRYIMCNISMLCNKLPFLCRSKTLNDL